MGIVSALVGVATDQARHKGCAGGKRIAVKKRRRLRRKIHEFLSYRKSQRGECWEQGSVVVVEVREL